MAHHIFILEKTSLIIFQPTHDVGQRSDNSNKNIRWVYRPDISNYIGDLVNIIGGKQQLVERFQYVACPLSVNKEADLPPICISNRSVYNIPIAKSLYI